MDAQLLFWEPRGTSAQVRSVTTAVEVQALADDLLARYEAARDILPGIELHRDDDDGASLSIAVARFGWALVHTDAEVNQHCTRQADTPVSESPDVRWEEPTSVPRSWFIPTELALVGISRWLADGSLAPELPWSDQCS